MTPTRSGISVALIEMVHGDGKPVLHLSRWSYLEPYWPAISWEGIVCQRGPNQQRWDLVGEHEWDWPLCSSCVARVRRHLFPVERIQRTISRAVKVAR